MSVEQRAQIGATGIISFLGLTIPLAPVVIGLATCMLVRLPLIKRGNLVAEICLTGIALIGTAVTIIENNIAPGLSFWTGLGFGAIASSLIEVAKTAMLDGLKERFKAAGRILFGVKEN